MLVWISLLPKHILLKGVPRVTLVYTMPSQPSVLIHALLHSSTDTSFTDAPLPEPVDPGNDTAGAPRHESAQCMTSVGGDLEVAAGVVVVVGAGVVVDVVVVVGAGVVVVGHPWPLNLQHHSALGVDHAVDCSVAGLQSKVVVLEVVVVVLMIFSTATQPSLRCWQHQLRFSADQS